MAFGVQNGFGQTTEPGDPGQKLNGKTCRSDFVWDESARRVKCVCYTNNCNSPATCGSCFEITEVSGHSYWELYLPIPEVTIKIEDWSTETRDLENGTETILEYTPYTEEE